jgi:endoglucanase
MAYTSTLFLLIGAAVLCGSVRAASLFSSCSSVIPIPGNSASAGADTCAACNNGAQTWWPCDIDSVCYCSGGTIPPQYLKRFSSCSNVIAIPGNTAGATTQQCAACNGGAQAWWPCDTDSLCYCSGGTIPPAYVLPFTYCQTAIAVPGNTNNVNDAACADCAGAKNRYYPCDQPNVLCKCANGTLAATPAPGATTTAAPPTPVPPVPSTPRPATTTPTTAAPTPSPTQPPVATPPPAPGSVTYSCQPPATSGLGSANDTTSAISVANRGASSFSTAAGSNTARVMRVFTETQFAYLFSLANQGAGPGGAYTYQNFLNAVSSFPDFCDRSGRTGVSKDDMCKLELATLFAHFVQETGANDAGRAIPTWRQGLWYLSEIGCDVTPAAAHCDYTLWSGWAADAYPPSPNKQYYGRGPFQLSWNYNYGPFSRAVFGDVNFVLERPELLSGVVPEYAWLAFAATIWFYMTPQPPKPSMHDVVTGMFVPNAVESANGNTGFGATIQIINGGLECGFASAQASNRVASYDNFCSYFGITAISGYGSKTCSSMKPFPTSGGSIPNLYWDREWQTACACKLVQWQTPYAVVGDVGGSYARCVRAIGGCQSQCTIVDQPLTSVPIPPTPVPPTPPPATTVAASTSAAPTPVPPTPVPPTPAPTTTTASTTTTAPATTAAPASNTSASSTTATPPTPVPPTAAPSTPAPSTTAATTAASTAAPVSGGLTGNFGNTMATFGIGQQPVCGTSTSYNATCGGFDYEQALCMSMSFYMAQGGGRSVGGQEWRGTCYPADGGAKNLSLGWFDAGDYVKFGLPMAYSATALAWGALEFPDGYRPNTQARLGLLYNLRHFAFYALEGWDPVQQKLIAQIGDGDADHASWYPCKARSDNRPVYYITAQCPGTEVAADTASALAAIALVLKQFEGSYSESLQQRLATAALQIYTFGDTRRGSYTDCVPGSAAFYASYSGYTDELALAGTWMASLQAAGLIPAGVDYVAKARAVYSTPYNIDWDNKNLGAAVRLFQLTGTASYANDVAARVTAYRTATPKTTGGMLKIMQWGALRHAANCAFIARMAAKLGIGNDNDGNMIFAKSQLDYILGNNPMRLSYVLGFGTAFPKNPHHRGSHDSPTGNINSPANNRWVLTGAVVGGPFNSDSYSDDRGDYVTSEVTTDYNALLSGLIASFVGKNCQYPMGATAAPPPPTTQAPRGSSVPAGGVFSVNVVLLQEWWIQVQINPQPARVVVNYNGNLQATLEGPKWGDHWTITPSSALLDSAQVAIDIYRTAGDASPYVSLLREGPLKLNILKTGSSRRQSATGGGYTFDAPTFLRNVSSALGVSSSRVFLASISDDGQDIGVYVLPLPYSAYGGEGAARASDAGSSTGKTNAALQTALNSSTSAESQGLRATAGVEVKTVAFDDPLSQTPAPSPSDVAESSEMKCGSLCIVLIVVIVFFVVLVVGMLAFVWCRNRSKTIETEAKEAA